MELGNDLYEYYVTCCGQERDAPVINLGYELIVQLLNDGANMLCPPPCGAGETNVNFVASKTRDM